VRGVLERFLMGVKEYDDLDRIEIKLQKIELRTTTYIRGRELTGDHRESRARLAIG